MIVSSELTNRLLQKLIMADPSIAQDPMGINDLGRAVLRNPQRYATDDEDKAFIELGKAVAQMRRDVDDELDARADAIDAGKEPPTPSKLPRSRALVNRCLEIDPHCYDARTLMVLLDADSADKGFEALEAIEPEAREWCTARALRDDELSDEPWRAIHMRPWLRMKAKQIDLLIQMSCYREALARCEEMLSFAPQDAQGMRHTAALLYSRLEDESGLEALDVRFGRQQSCWMHIARSLLLYKLGRMDAARRATNGLARLCPGAAFYLAYPSYVEPYLPDRPVFAPGTDKESLYATYEADFLVMDTPGYVTWALSLGAFDKAVKQFGKASGEW